MTTSGNGSGCKTGRGLKPSLAAVYSARQQRTENSTTHSRQSSPGGRGGGFFTDSASGCQVLSPHSAPTSPTGVLNFDVTWKQAMGGLGRSMTCSVGKDCEVKNQQTPKPKRQCSCNSRDSSTSQDSSTSVSMESSGPTFVPAPPQSMPTRRSSGSSLNSQRRMLALPGVTESNYGFPWQDIGSPRPAWQFSPRERSRDPSPEDLLPPRRMREQRSRDGSITPVMSPLPVFLEIPSSPSRSIPSGAYFSPRPPGKESIFNHDATGLASQSSFLHMAPSDVQRGDSPHEADIKGRFNVEKLQSLLAAAAVGSRSRSRDREALSPSYEERIAEDSSLPALREGWQVSLCQNVVLRCPSKLPTKDTFAQRKVPRPVSLEGSLKSCDGDSLSSPPSPASPLSPRGPSKERGATRPRREGRSFQRRPVEETKTPDEDMDMRDARIQMLMQERRLSSAGFHSPIFSPRGDLAQVQPISPSASEFPASLSREDGEEHSVQEQLSKQLYEVKLEIVRGLAAASSSSRRSSMQDNFAAGYSG